MRGSLSVSGGVARWWGGAVCGLVLTGVACGPPKPIQSVAPPPLAAPTTSAPPPAASTLVESDGPPREPDVVFWPTPPEVVRKMIEVADVKSTDVVYDLGSGDGRIVIATAKQRGARGYGFEIDAKLVEASRESAREQGVDHLVTFIRRDIFTVDVSAATVVMLYLLPGMLRRLEPQLKLLKPGTRVVSHNFPMTGVEPDQVFNADLPGSAHTVLLWIAPLKIPIRAATARLGRFQRAPAHHSARRVYTSPRFIGGVSARKETPERAEPRETGAASRPKHRSRERVFARVEMPVAICFMPRGASPKSCSDFPPLAKTRGVG